MFTNRFFKRAAFALTGVTLAFALLTQPALANQPEPPPGCFTLKPYQHPAKPTSIDKKLLSTMEKYTLKVDSKLSF